MVLNSIAITYFLTRKMTISILQGVYIPKVQAELYSEEVIIFHL